MSSVTRTHSAPSRDVRPTNGDLYREFLATKTCDKNMVGFRQAHLAWDLDITRYLPWFGVKRTVIAISSAAFVLINSREKKSAWTARSLICNAASTLTAFISRSQGVEVEDQGLILLEGGKEGSTTFTSASASAAHMDKIRERQPSPGSRVQACNRIFNGTIWKSN
jgi:hypothetical protein